MNILALESSTSTTSVSVCRGMAAPCVSLEFSDAHKSSDVMLKMVDDALEQASLARQDLQAVAYGCGPGAFTGLRSACAVAQGIAFGLRLPTLGVTSLEAVAEQAFASSGNRRVMSLMDARMNEVYAQPLVRDAAGLWHGQGPIQVIAIAAINWPEDIKPWQGAGNAWHAAALAAALAAATPRQVIAPLVATVPRAEEVAQLAWRQLEQRGLPGLVDMAQMMAQPLYVRDHVAQTTAERMREKAAKELAST